MTETRAALHDAKMSSIEEIAGVALVYKINVIYEINVVIVTLITLV
jgi:hypothetical protein